MTRLAEWLAGHWFAVALFAAYTGFLVAHARAGMRRGRAVRDFYVGGRSMGGVVIGVSFYATFASTNSYIGHAGKGYEYGVPWLTMAVMLVVMAFVSWRLVAPKLRRFTAEWDSVTVPDFLAVRFASPRVRIAAALVIAVSSVLYLIAIFKGAGNLFEAFLGVPYPAAVGITLVIVMSYTSLGGFVSVVRTDVLQGVLMVVGALLLFGFVTHAAGGVGVIRELGARPDTSHLTELNAAIPFVVLVGIALAGSLKLLVDPRQVTRFYGLRDARSIRVGMWIAGIGILVVQFSLLPVGALRPLLARRRDGHGRRGAALGDEPGGVPGPGGRLPRRRDPGRGDVVAGQRPPRRRVGGRAGHPHGTRSAVRPSGHRVDAVVRDRLRRGGGGRRPRPAGRHRRDHHLLRQPVRRVLHPDRRDRPALASRQRDGRPRRVRDGHHGARRMAAARLAGASPRGVPGPRGVDHRLCGAGADYATGGGSAGRRLLPPLIRERR